jgi:aspartate/methionine/tyrosine aminotransferase
MASLDTDRDFRPAVTAQIGRLHMPNGAGPGEPSIVAAERRLDAHAHRLGRPLLNATYADTKRFPPPPWALEAFTAAASGGGPSYTAYRGDATVREQVARSVSDFIGIPVDPDSELIVTPGSQAALFTVMSAMLEPGDRVVLLDPDYLAYERLVRFLGAEVDHVPLTWEDGAGTIDPASLAAAIREETRCIVVSNPNNPTGAVLSRATVEAIAAAARERDLLVVIDELYARLVYDGRAYVHLAALDGMAQRTVTVLGPSKTESMTGYRVGVACGPRPIIDAMEDVLSVAALRAPAYAQQALVHWLRDDQEFLSTRIGEYERLRDMTVARLAASSAVELVVPGGTAYGFPTLVDRGISDQELAIALMDGADMIVNPGYQFGPSGHGSFRICFAQEESVWEQALTRMVAVLESISSGQPARS